jgi:hypothetical protein
LNFHWQPSPQIPFQDVGQLSVTQVITAENATPTTENRTKIPLNHHKITKANYHD